MVVSASTPLPGLADDFDPAQLFEQKPQLVPGQLLVVDEDCA